MSLRSQPNELQEGDCSNTEDPWQRTPDHQSASSSSSHWDHSSQRIIAVAWMQRNESQCSNRASTLEQLRDVIEKRVDRACTQCRMGLAASGEHHEGAVWRGRISSCYRLASLQHKAPTEFRPGGVLVSRLLHQSTQEVTKAAIACTLRDQCTHNLCVMHLRDIFKMLWITINQAIFV